MVVVIAALVVAMVAVALSAIAVRVGRLRFHGSPIIFRELPAADQSGWRHGILVYGEDAVCYYRLTSLRRGPSRAMSRQNLEIVGRRSPLGSELEIMDDVMTIVEVIDESVRGELAFERDALTAFLAWIESRPSPRSRRRRLTDR